jgi:hypothetical protein
VWINALTDLGGWNTLLCHKDPQASYDRASLTNWALVSSSAAEYVAGIVHRWDL